ncbi:ABC transporter permease [Pseudoalteromonas sp. T1lg48]|uniref:ABC transporter permease n=1 Tax=Pseudoalteromonas sp. T1lg48 TaxID=2077100 RepID=UPI000CF7203C|nr:ABC transporter permease [Pseudoalteromonas sp. T1lg48]
MASLIMHIKMALASLRQAPGFVAASVSTLAITLACFFVVMSLFSSYFVAPLNVEQESRLVIVEQDNIYPDYNSPGFQSFQSVLHWYKTQTSFSRHALVNSGEDVISNLPGKPRIPMTFASDDYYELFRVPLALGQYMSAQQRVEEPLDEVLISYDFWQRYYGGDDGVIGQTLIKLDKHYRIVGVVEKDYQDPYMFNRGDNQLWFKFSADTRYFNDENPSAWWNLFRGMKLVGVLKPEATKESVEAELYQRIQDIKAQWRAEFNELKDLKPIVTPFRQAELGDNDDLAVMLLAGVIALVLIALLNVSNLFIARAVAKHKTLALQAVLGAKRKALFTSILAETFVLMASAVAVALFIAAWGVKLFKWISAGHMPLVHTVGIDLTVVTSALVLCTLFALLFAWITSRLINFNQLRSQVQSSGKGAVSQISMRTVKWMIAIQLFLATGLVIAATMVLHKSVETLQRPMGSRVDNLYQTLVYIEQNRDELAKRYDDLQLFLAAAQQIPGVKAVTHGESPVDRGKRASTIKDMSGKDSIFIPQAWVGRDYFEFTGLKIIEGRTFSEAAIRGEKNEFLVTKAVNDLLKPGGSLIGEKFYSFDPANPVEVVGITENFNHPKFYHEDLGRHFWWPARPYAFALLIEMEPGRMLDRETVFQAMQEVSNRAGIWSFKSLEEQHAAITHLDKVTLVLCSVLGLFTLVLAGIGIYGVLSYNLKLRRYELGMRMALGAKRNLLYRQLIKDTIMPLVIAFTLALALSLGGYLLFQQSVMLWLSLNPLWLLLVSSGIIVFALTSVIWPMRQLIRDKPMAALKQQ